jgi:hypothetical protein
VANPRLSNDTKTPLSDARPQLIIKTNAVQKNNFRIFLMKYRLDKNIVPKDILSKKAKPLPQPDKLSTSDQDNKIIVLSDSARTPEIINLESHIKNTTNIDGIVIEKAALSSKYIDEINHLVKKLTLSFSAKKSESCFFIKDGIFKNARFNLYCQDKNLDLVLAHAKPEAIDLINRHQDYLATKLAKKEINLRKLVFA